MLEKLIKDLANQHPLIELERADWIRFGHAFAQEQDKLKADLFVNALSSHTGVPAFKIHFVFYSLKHDILSENVLTELGQAQQQTTLKIIEFKQHAFFKTIALERLSISRSEWNALIAKFEKQQRHHVSSMFFLISLSTIQKIGFDELVLTLSTAQPERQAKRQCTVKPSVAKRLRHFSYMEDDGVNPLVFESTADNPDLEAKLTETGVRVVEALAIATPVKGYSTVKKTPGGTRVRPIFSVGNQLSFFKGLSPIRFDVDRASAERIKTALPKLNFVRAQTVEYTATLAPIIERSGLSRRKTSRTLMGASATEVFQAHGVEIKPTDFRSQHWAHLIAHFLTAEEHIISAAPDEELVNLVPSTAAANYNTLEAVELFIRSKLVDKDTDQIHIRVTPNYSAQNLIPDTLVYTLSWKEVKNETIVPCSEVFFISPQSHHRITKSMHRSIAVLREARDTLFFDKLPIERRTELEQATPPSLNLM